MKTCSWLVLSLLLISSISCKNDSQSKPFGQMFFEKDSTKLAFSKAPYFISNSSRDWSVGFIGSFDAFDSLSIRLSKTEADTSKSVTLSLDKNRNAISVLIYLKEYKDRKRNYSVMFGPKDTLYSYYTSEDTQKKHFLVGEYYYRGVHRGFDPDETIYYLLHKDSLDRVRGNDLSKLPIVYK